jgi:hypothetical protein
MLQLQSAPTSARQPGQQYDERQSQAQCGEPVSRVGKKRPAPAVAADVVETNRRAPRYHQVIWHEGAD